MSRPNPHHRRTQNARPGLIEAARQFIRRALGMEEQGSYRRFARRRGKLTYEEMARPQSRTDRPHVQVLYCTCGAPDCDRFVLSLHNPQMSEIHPTGALVPYVKIGPREARLLAEDLIKFADHACKG